MNLGKQAQGARFRAQGKILFCALSFVLCAGLLSPIFAMEKGSGTISLKGGQAPFLKDENGARPQRIVSLSTVVTEEIFLLGEGKRLVGRSHFCVRPAEAQKIPEAGNIVDINLEKVVSLAPDLVTVTPMLDPRAVAKMRALGLRVETFAPAKNFKGVNESFLRLARMLGKEAEAARIVEEQERAMELLRRKVPPSSELSVFLEIGAEPLVTVTKDSFLNDLIEFAGGKNIAKGAERALYSREKVLSQDPDMIIISSMGFDGEKEKQMWRKYPELKAVLGNRIVIVNSDLFCSPTPVTFTRALESMIHILHANYVT
ncbi:MAG: hypothetical protein A2351_03605 [Omnitrophica bacterium RIFOXYB12_FULL_50_7]|nr:MAG: hypothetical protein A2351_03605 [Omnitrophica bacterium RIFOXYB12_FULL_50_7]